MGFLTFMLTNFLDFRVDTKMYRNPNFVVVLYIKS